MWFIYGLASGNVPVWLANGFTLILASIILFFKIREPKTENKSGR
jgi:MtN3 and saliva related transmembrane protein